MTTRVLVGDCREMLRTLPDESVLAYCAGVIDSDGYIGIKCSTYSMRVTGDSRQPTYSERICVKQVEPEAVTLLHGIFGGTFTSARSYSRKGRPLYSWQVTDKRAAGCLAAIVPFLRIKQVKPRICRVGAQTHNRRRAAICRGRGMKVQRFECDGPGCVQSVNGDLPPDWTQTLITWLNIRGEPMKHAAEYCPTCWPKFRRFMKGEAE